MDFMGWQELMLIAVVGLIVIGPERLPETLRTLGLWIGRLRRSFVSVKTEIEKEIGMDDIRRQLHNEAVMEEMRKIEEEVKSSVDPAISLNEGPPLYSDDTAPTHTTDAKIPSDEAIADAHAPNRPAPTVATEEEVATESAETIHADSAPVTPLPRTEAELEAMHEARQKRLKEADPS